ncbi:MAG: diguanylate cyclase domain-containing protein [Gallionella sp.]
MLKSLLMAARHLRLGALERFPYIILSKLGSLHPYLLAIALMVLALWIRLLIDPIDSGLPYLTFFPAVAIAAIAGGYRAGLLAMIIGVGFGTYIFTPPYFSFSLESFRLSLWPNMVFMVDGIIVSFAIETMHRYRKQYEIKFEAARESEERVLKLNQDLIRQIADRNKFEARLGESEERLRLALSGAGEGIWDVEPLTGRVTFDSQWGRMLGYGAEKDKPHYIEDWAALIHPEDKEYVLKAMNDHIEGRVPEYQAEYRIRSHSGAWKWVSGHGRAVQRDVDGKALRIVGVTHDITLKKQAEDRIWKLAHFDSLTGLPNRALFYDRLSQSAATAKRHHKKLALLFLDLDGFKQINDKFGHNTGDALLVEVAERLQQYIRGEDTVARVGGDEFLFILNHISNAGNAAIVANKIISSLAEPIVINKNTCQIGGSIGISIFPDDGDDMETLVKQADNAMYKAKACGKNNFQFFKTP